MTSSPATTPTSPSNKPESILEFLGTIGRRKKIKEVEELTEEGKQAIDGSTISPAIDNLPEEFVLDEFEERSMIEPSMYENKYFQELIKILINWINDELSDQRIIVRNLEEDLYDGQILGKLVEKLSGQKLDVIEVTQNEDLQKSKLRAVLDTANRLLGLQSRWAAIKWTVEGIHNKHLVQIIHLLVTLIRHYRAPIRLPENVVVNLVVVQKRDGHLHTRTVSEQLTGSYDELGMRIEPRDAFDTLFDHAPDKLQIVKRSLVNFVNKHLNKVNIECYSGQTGGDLDPNQFSDGLLIIFLMGMCEGYFVPLGNIFTTTTDPLADVNSPKETALSPDNYVDSSPIHKLHNVQVAFQLMEDAGIQVRHKVRAEDIANADLKSTLRVLYMIFTKYKHV
ncbi:beta-parvin-like protein [Leptotrombidium deliense]|uniref:Beta-parvin-like protein n=1 Tax=Leptotrombidium deliense TaxID=299467 RepID=A0A443SW16_9ACAR|nr:beta-parvin-like protein [Leptotrombidium deliense]